MPSIFSSILLLFSSSLIAFLSSHSAMATSNFLAMDDFQNGNGSSSFMDSLSAEQQKQFFEIVMNPNASKAQQKNQLAAWASSSGVQSQYESCLQRMQQDFAQMESVAQQNLQGSALNLFNQLASLHKDDSLTSLQECGQMFDIFNSTQPPTVLMFVPKKWFVDQCSPAMIGQKFEGGDSDSDIEPNDGDEEEK